MSTPVPETPDPASPSRPRRRPFDAVWSCLLVGLVGASLAAAWLAPCDPLMQLPDGLSPFGTPLAPSLSHPLGTDELGRDVLSRLLHGGKLSLLIAAGSTLLAGALGLLLGLSAGYWGRGVDQGVMRATEVFMAFPAILLAVALAAVLPPGPWSAVLTLGMVGWPGLARMVRGQVLALKEQEFIEASRALGAGHLRILSEHVWPNVRPVAMTLLALKFADMLLMEAALGFLGLGVPPPTPTWGAMVGEAKAYFFHAPWLGLPAGAAIFLTVLAVNMMADRRLARGTSRF
ncbi:MAG: ABC transporter permease [Candidatus Sericytochromatia bacterium]|nr:ABC transporter permease [Candidatus Sericytochromatia bacterium]